MPLQCWHRRSRYVICFCLSICLCSSYVCFAYFVQIQFLGSLPPSILCVTFAAWRGAYSTQHFFQWHHNKLTLVHHDSLHTPCVHGKNAYSYAFNLITAHTVDDKIKHFTILQQGSFLCHNALFNILFSLWSQQH